MWKERALNLKEEGYRPVDIYKILCDEGYDVNYNTMRKFLNPNNHIKGKIVYKDKKEPTEQDVEAFIKAMHDIQKKIQKLDTKQTKASFEIDDDKPVCIAWWGDWHEGSLGTDYEQLDKDTEIIANTDGLYWIGGGDYKDNYLTHGHAGAQYEQIIQPGMQDLAVKHRMRKVAHNCIALVRGCHDDWDKKDGDKDFISTLCEEVNALNLWHGGDLYIKIGNQEYHWKVRHKYKYESSLNVENSMRRIMEVQGPCDVACVAHLHNPYCQQRHLMGEQRVFMRTGSYKIWDEHGQKNAGYKGKVGIPCVILFPDEKEMIPLYLPQAIKLLKVLRR